MNEKDITNLYLKISKSTDEINKQIQTLKNDLRGKEDKFGINYNTDTNLRSIFNIDYDSKRTMAKIFQTIRKIDEYKLIPEEDIKNIIKTETDPNKTFDKVCIFKTSENEYCIRYKQTILRPCYHNNDPNQYLDGFEIIYNMLSPNENDYRAIIKDLEFKNKCLDTLIKYAGTTVETAINVITEKIQETKND